MPITSAVPLRTVRGTLDELAQRHRRQEPGCGCTFAERPRAGLREAVQEMLPRALEVRIDPEMLAEVDPAAARAPKRPAALPGEMFADYLSAQGHADPDVAALFDRLYAEVDVPGGVA